MTCSCPPRVAGQPVGLLSDLAEGVGELAGAVKDVTGTARQIYSDVSDGLRGLAGAGDARRARSQAQSLQQQLDALQARLDAAEARANHQLSMASQRIRNASGRAEFYQRQWQMALELLEPLGVVRRYDRTETRGGQRVVVGHGFQWAELADKEDSSSPPADWIRARIVEAAGGVGEDNDDGDGPSLLGMLGAAAVGFVGGRASKRGGQ